MGPKRAKMVEISKKIEFFEKFAEFATDPQFFDLDQKISLRRRTTTPSAGGISEIQHADTADFAEKVASVDGHRKRQKRPSPIPVWIPAQCLVLMNCVRSQQPTGDFEKTTILPKTAPSRKNAFLLTKNGRFWPLLTRSSKKGKKWPKRSKLQKNSVFFEKFAKFWTNPEKKIFADFGSFSTQKFR